MKETVKRGAIKLIEREAANDKFLAAYDSSSPLVSCGLLLCVCSGGGSEQKMIQQQSKSPRAFLPKKRSRSRLLDQTRGDFFELSSFVGVRNFAHVIGRFTRFALYFWTPIF
jgi:hypothetical protein